MKKKMKYSLYKQSYSQFPADEYDARTKTIMVDLPGQPVKLPRWEISGNHYNTPGGSHVYFWNTGLARNYLVEFDGRQKTVPAGFDSAERVLEIVDYFEGR